MKNPIVDGHEAADIQRQVQKVLRDLGHPHPPLDLDVVRQLLKLDRAYFRSSDEGMLREVVHAMKLAGKQVLREPMRIIDAIRKWDLRALWVPKQRRILLDLDQPKLKHRWSEGHEIGHVLTPWHSQFLFGDNEATLCRTHHERIEAEANFCAGQLLFLQGQFSVRADSLPIGIETVKVLWKQFGNTLTSTLWHFIEAARVDRALVGLVSGTRARPATKTTFEEPRRYYIQSPRFRTEFSQTTETAVLEIVERYCSRRRGGPLGGTTVVLNNDRGEPFVFQFETFSNRYDALTLGWLLRPQGATVGGWPPPPW